VIEQILVDRGDMVQRGQPVVALNAAVERAALALAQQRANQQGEVAATTGARQLAERELQRADELYRKKFVSGTYLDKQRAEAEVATGRSAEAAERRALAERELALASTQLAQRTLRSPITGVVVERSMALGEYVDQKPVLRIAAIDPLRVDVLVPAAAFGQVTLGMGATVVPELVDRRSLSATVKTVDRVIDAASNTFRVRLSLPNPGGTLPAGLRCKVDLGTTAAAPPVASASAAAVPAAGTGVAGARR
jgi:RND family efflux transporter MFP subunit